MILNRLRNALYGPVPLAANSQLEMLQSLERLLDEDDAPPPPPNRSDHAPGQRLTSGHLRKPSAAAEELVAQKEAALKAAQAAFAEMVRCNPSPLPFGSAAQPRDSLSLGVVLVPRTTTIIGCASSNNGRQTKR